MGRRWIGIELGDHCHTHCLPRLKKVVDGEDAGGITQAVGWKGGGGFRYYRLAPSLLEKDAWGNWVINKDFNREMLAEAVCKLEGFAYSPSDSVWWQHGYPPLPHSGPATERRGNEQGDPEPVGVGRGLPLQWLD